jgi:autotransporter strand-loop-strand O-heptosyltransferase
MFKKVNAFASFGLRTGYQVHSTNFFNELEKLIPVERTLPYDGDISISLLDSVGAQYVNFRHPFPSILYNVWESTAQPSGFLGILKLYDQLWVPSEWQRQCSIDQGINPDFVKVVPEGIDPYVYKPASISDPNTGTFYFLIVGKWEHRKATREMVQAWLEVFKEVPNAVLQISADNPFPVDQYRTTEERLKGYGLESDKIEIVHFEDKEDYIHRLRNTHVYLSCSRAEGWGLPLIEAMSCGIPSVALNWSGSTEYAKEAMLVRVKEFKKPEHVYGMSDCPGLWAEPDFDNFKEVIWDAYKNWEKHRAKALETAKYIHENFSWKKAAEKAMVIFNEIKINKEQELSPISNKGQIFCVGCWPNSEEKMNTLSETIKQIKAEGFPVLITSHYPLPPAIIEMVDYYIYDKRNILSDDWRATYYRDNNGVVETTKAKIPYHAVAVMHAIENAIDFCKGRYEVMHYMEYDVEFDVREYLKLWNQKPSEKSMLTIAYERQRGITAIQSCLFSAKVDHLVKYFPRVNTWEEYLSKYGEENYVLEQWLMKAFHEKDSLYQRMEIIDYPITNRFDQVDREAWPNDIFSCNFLSGPTLTINGMSRREYEVSFHNSKDGEAYKLLQKVGTWSQASAKYFCDWNIKAMIDGELKFEHKLDLNGKRVIIAMGSKALGDTVAWIPYFEEFRKKHGCHVIASSWFNELFDYPEIEWTTPGSAHKDIYAVYEVGCYDNDRTRNKRDWRTVRMQEIATDILGLDYKEIKPRMKNVTPLKFGKKHVCFSEHSTMQAKLWNRPGGWQAVINYLKDLGYDVVSISKEPTGLKNVIAQNNRSIEETVAAMRGAELYIGLGAGPSWLAWALNLPVVMISGFSDPKCEYDNPYRVFPSNGVCKGCFNDPIFKLDRGWDWCPSGKDYECTKSITSDMVIEKIEDIITRP